MPIDIENILTLNKQAEIKELLGLADDIHIYINKPNFNSDDFGYKYTLCVESTINNKGIRDILATIKISSFPGCCGIMIINQLNVGSYYRNKGLGKFMVDFAINKCKTTHKCGIILATDKVKNEFGIKIMQHIGFKELKEFDNPNSDNTVTIQYITYQDYKGIPNKEV